MSKINIFEIQRIINFFQTDDITKLSIPSHNINNENIKDKREDSMNDLKINNQVINNQAINNRVINNEEMNNKLSKNQSQKKRKIFCSKDRGKVWENIFGRQYTNICPLCQKNIMQALDTDTWHMGHIQAWSKGGSDTLENIRPICIACNKSMGSENLKDYCKRKFSKNYEEIMKKLKL